MTRRRFFPRRTRLPLYRGTVLDDFLFAQPLNSLMRLARLLLARKSEQEGITIVIVNYRSQNLLSTVLAASRHFSPADTRIIVVDNGSRDGSWEWLRTRPFGIDPVKLPVNLGHGRALDLGVFLARTTKVVTLDSDAFPYAHTWLDLLTGPLERPEVLAAGCWGPRDRLHPACAIYRRAALLSRGLSFHNFNLHKDLEEEPVFGANTWDTGELIFEDLGPERTVIYPTEPGFDGFGKRMGGVVYHHTGMTTGVTDDPADRFRLKTAMWERACEELLGPGWQTLGQSVVR